MYIIYSIHLIYTLMYNNRKHNIYNNYIQQAEANYKFLPHNKKFLQHYSPNVAGGLGKLEK